MELVTVVRHINAASADVDAARLQAAGFSVLKNGENTSLSGLGGLVGEVLLQVPEDQAEAAKALLAADAVEPDCDCESTDPEDQGS
ncbi:MAG TPA: hypothetical protein VMF06_02400 [Candidatus Limnocylindria bacterium]|jgi:hypothetical protein|nr:hypothetical protein [Candidatus Limnocylindria bacterium]